MATYYKIRYSAVATPIEEPQLTDTSQTLRGIHSSIDKIVGGGIEKTYATTATNIKYATYTTTTSGVALSNALIFNSIFTIDFLMIKIISKASTSTPEILLSLDGINYYLQAFGVGDTMMISGIGDSQGIVTRSSSNLFIKSPGSSGLANIELLASVKS